MNSLSVGRSRCLKNFWRTLARGISVTLDIDRHLPEVRGDDTQLQQVMINLLQDAFGAVEGCDALARRAELADIPSRLNKLTPREREVMTRVVEGYLNKQVASERGAAEKTIKNHRAA
ncbi:LuxR C-terminal-related transcriptional regulator [Paraburkholderia caledonica]|jgi:DNA-binding NarL/FixJ family response regulator|uniref:LuxR C-terminal-related transcriptional regulator n=1 Tax=Paraburkholderia caledonica TaxID=134536 RepID=UPI00268949CF